VPKTGEHEHEPQRGLPAPLPPGEHVVWQGSPEWRALAREAFHVRKLAVYFAGLLVLRGTAVASDGGDALRAMAVLAPLLVAALGFVLFIARASARGTVYTVTNRRIVMRIGIVLTVTFNLPFARIAGAAMSRHVDGRGDIALALAEGDRIGWAHLWPHCRPWRVARPQPMLRCIAEPEAVARRLTDAWVAATGGLASADAAPPRVARRPATPALARG
jgi:hypothetical protein